jgi:hypothetical protein
MRCTLFEANTCPWRDTSKPVLISRIEFCEGYQLYNPCLLRCQREWTIWSDNPENWKKPNAWSHVISEEAEMLALALGPPNHFAFFQEHKYGAFISDLDYFQVVIIDPNAIKLVHVQKREVVGPVGH